MNNAGEQLILSTIKVIDDTEEVRKELKKFSCSLTKRQALKLFGELWSLQYENEKMNDICFSFKHYLTYKIVA